MKSVFFLVATAAPLVAFADPGDMDLAEVVRRQTGSRLLARTGIATSSISKECLSQCSPIITKLNACTLFFFLIRVVHFFGAIGAVGLQRRRFMRMRTSKLRSPWELPKLSPSTQLARRCALLTWF